MFRFWSRGAKFWMGANDFKKLRVRAEAGPKRPVALCGTAFGFVHFLDFAGWPKNCGSRAEAGCSRPVASRAVRAKLPKSELYAQLAHAFGVARSRHLERVRHERAFQPGLRPWHEWPARRAALGARPRRRSCHRDVRSRRAGNGLVRWIDLANVDSVLALQTLDRAVRVGQGQFRLIGRLPRTEPRGCSLGVEDLLGDSHESRRHANDIDAAGARLSANCFHARELASARAKRSWEACRGAESLDRARRRARVRARAPRRDSSCLRRKSRHLRNHQHRAGPDLLGSHNTVQLPSPRDDDAETRREITAFVRTLPQRPARSRVELHATRNESALSSGSRRHHRLRQRLRR